MGSDRACSPVMVGLEEKGNLPYLALKAQPRAAELATSLMYTGALKTSANTCSMK